MSEPFILQETTIESSSKDMTEKVNEKIDAVFKLTGVNQKKANEEDGKDLK